MPSKIQIYCCSILIIGCVIGCNFRGNRFPDDAKPIRASNLRSTSTPHFSSHRPRKVLVVNSDRGATKQIPAKLAFAIASECKSKMLFEAVVPETNECNMQLDEILAGRFYESNLIQLANQYNADSVLLFRINHIRFHQPLMASVTAVMIDVREAIPTYSADGVWDMAENITQAQFQDYLVARSGGQDPSLMNIHAQSPDRMLSYIAWEIAASMGKKF